MQANLRNLATYAMADEWLDATETGVRAESDVVDSFVCGKCHCEGTHAAHCRFVRKYFPKITRTWINGYKAASDVKTEKADPPPYDSV